MSYNSRQRTSGPWRDQYYPYQTHHDQWQAPADTYYGYDNNYVYDNNYGYDDGQYSAPSSSRSNDYYYRDTYNDTNQYGYGYPEHQPSGYDERDYHRSGRHSPTFRRRRRDWQETDHPPTGPKQSVPAPYRHERDDRPVTPPPPRSPSPSYLAVADEPPSSLPAATEERKLLILDLNGTLVHRSALARPKNKGAPSAAPAVDDNGRPLPRLRPVHPRPYMAAFRSYLFAPETRAWLDVMVWSSAQPHSVGDMVDRCFAEEKEKLLAIWARDTLGLTQDHYYRKVQTVKDLNTPWSKLSSKTDAYDSEASSGDEFAKRRAPSRRTVHSALTTLLLDDSPRKAELQPYNHVCIPEYSGELRAKDLEALRVEQLLADVDEDATNPMPDDGAAPSGTEPETNVSSVPEGNIENARKRKRKEKKDLKRQQAVLDAQSRADRDAKTYDETLLAVIGVLDEIKLQRNVAAWIRTGGLWGPHQGHMLSASNAVGANTEDTSPIAEPPSSSPASPQSSQKDTERDASNAGADDEEGRSDSGGERQMSRKEKKRRLRQTKSVEAEGVRQAGTGNDVASTADSHATAEKDDGEETTGAAPSIWFDCRPTVQYWVERGKKALQELQIPVEHGIDR